MPDNITIQLSERYKQPTMEQIQAASNYVALRGKTSDLLIALIDALLESAAAKITTICYKYNVDPKTFQLSEEYNKRMMEEVSAVMDELEAEILDLIEEYSAECAKDEKHRTALLLWLATLGRGNNNLQDTLHGYLHKTLKDWEAAIAALRWAKISQTRAISIIRSNLHSIYLIAQVRAAIKSPQKFAATFIKYGGVMPGGRGLSNNGSTNVTNMAAITLQMAWNKEQETEFKENGAVGFYQMRGSNYPCDICDMEVGYHLGDMDEKPLVHPHCQCIRIPIYNKEEMDTIIDELS